MQIYDLWDTEENYIRCRFEYNVINEIATVLVNFKDSYFDIGEKIHLNKDAIAVYLLKGTLKKPEKMKITKEYL
jgi:hypothetical protein